MSGGYVGGGEVESKVGMDDESLGECPICLEPFDDKVRPAYEICSIAPEKHQMCQSCYDELIASNPDGATCPQCRSALLEKAVPSLSYILKLDPATIDSEMVNDICISLLKTYAASSPERKCQAKEFFLRFSYSGQLDLKRREGVDHLFYYISKMVNEEDFALALWESSAPFMSNPADNNRAVRDAIIGFCYLNWPRALQPLLEMQKGLSGMDFYHKVELGWAIRHKNVNMLRILIPYVNDAAVISALSQITKLPYDRDEMRKLISDLFDRAKDDCKKVDIIYAAIIQGFYSGALSFLDPLTLTSESLEKLANHLVRSYRTPLSFQDLASVAALSGRCSKSLAGIIEGYEVNHVHLLLDVMAFLATRFEDFKDDEEQMEGMTKKVRELMEIRGKISLRIEQRAHQQSVFHALMAVMMTHDLALVKEFIAINPVEQETLNRALVFSGWLNTQKLLYRLRDARRNISFYLMSIGADPFVSSSLIIPKKEGFIEVHTVKVSFGDYCDTPDLSLMERFVQFQKGDNSPEVLEHARRFIEDPKVDLAVKKNLVRIDRVEPFFQAEFSSENAPFLKSLLKLHPELLEDFIPSWIKAEVMIDFCESSPEFIDGICGSLLATYSRLTPEMQDRAKQFFLHFSSSGQLDLKRREGEYHLFYYISKMVNEEDFALALWESSAPFMSNPADNNRAVRDAIIGFSSLNWTRALEFLLPFHGAVSGITVRRKTELDWAVCHGNVRMLCILIPYVFNDDEMASHHICPLVNFCITQLKARRALEAEFEQLIFNWVVPYALKSLQNSDNKELHDALYDLKQCLKSYITGKFQLGKDHIKDLLSGGKYGILNLPESGSRRTKYSIVNGYGFGDQTSVCKTVYELVKAKKGCFSVTAKRSLSSSGYLSIPDPFISSPAMLGLLELSPSYTSSAAVLQGLGEAPVGSVYEAEESDEEVKICLAVPVPVGQPICLYHPAQDSQDKPLSVSGCEREGSEAHLELPADDDLRVEFPAVPTSDPSTLKQRRMPCCRS